MMFLREVKVGIQSMVHDLTLEKKAKADIQSSSKMELKEATLDRFVRRLRPSMTVEEDRDS